MRERWAAKRKEGAATTDTGASSYKLRTNREGINSYKWFPTREIKSRMGKETVMPGMAEMEINSTKLSSRNTIAQFIFGQKISC
jgi:hypothetical protein